MKGATLCAGRMQWPPGFAAAGAMIGAMLLVACADHRSGATGGLPPAVEPIQYGPQDSAYAMDGSAEDSSSGRVDDLSEASVAAVLRDMHEPRLRGARTGADARILRFLWIRAFHPAVALRLLVRSDRCVLVTTVLSQPVTRFGPEDAKGIAYAIGTMPALILRRDSSDVPVPSCASLHRDFVAAIDWSAAAPHSYLGSDVSEWMVEVADSSGYRYAARWDFDTLTAKPFWRASAGALRLANMLPRPNEWH